MRQSTRRPFASFVGSWSVVGRLCAVALILIAVGGNFPRRGAGVVRIHHGERVRPDRRRAARHQCGGRQYRYRRGEDGHHGRIADPTR